MHYLFVLLLIVATLIDKGQSISRSIGSRLAGASGTRLSRAASVAGPISWSFDTSFNSQPVVNDKRFYDYNDRTDRLAAVAGRLAALAPNQDKVVSPIATLGLTPDGYINPNICPYCTSQEVVTEIQSIAQEISIYGDETLTMTTEQVHDLFNKIDARIVALKDIMERLEIIFGQEFKSETGTGILVAIRNSFKYFEENVAYTAQTHRHGIQWPYAYQLRKNFRSTLCRWYGADLKEKYCN